MSEYTGPVSYASRKRRTPSVRSPLRPPLSPTGTHTPPHAVPLRPIPQPATPQVQARYYFAYGSNLWHKQMLARCPSATLVGLGVLRGFRWCISIRGYANVLMSATDEVWGAVWLITPRDERVMDSYEGVSARAYDKYDLAVEIPDSRAGEPGLGAGVGLVEEKICLVYVDPRQEEGRPQLEYIDRFNAGLADTPLPPAYIKQYIRPYIPAPPPPIITIPSSQEVPVRCYFAYGPEMARAALGKLAPQARVLDIGMLPRYRWCIGVGGLPNVLPSPTDVVYGVVSSISRSDEELLDKAHALRDKLSLDVQLENGRGVVSCLVYLDPREGESGAGEELVRVMQLAVWDAKLPQEWVEEVIRPRIFGPEPKLIKGGGSVSGW